jgi:hypothetical protein
MASKSGLPQSKPGKSSKPKVTAIDTRMLNTRISQLSFERFADVPAKSQIKVEYVLNENLVVGATPGGESVLVATVIIDSTGESVAQKADQAALKVFTLKVGYQAAFAIESSDYPITNDSEIDGVVVAKLCDFILPLAISTFKAIMIQAEIAPIEMSWSARTAQKPDEKLISKPKK